MILDLVKQNFCSFQNLKNCSPEGKYSNKCELFTLGKESTILQTLTDWATDESFMYVLTAIPHKTQSAMTIGKMSCISIFQ